MQVVQQQNKPESKSHPSILLNSMLILVIKIILVIMILLVILVVCGGYTYGGFTYR